MPDYHILTQDRKRDEARVVFHFAVADQLNFAGVNVRTALVAYLESISETGTIVSAYPGISGAELIQLEAGEVIERVETVTFDANLTKAQKRDLIDARWTSLNSVIPARVLDQLDFWGYDRDVP